MTLATAYGTDVGVAPFLELVQTDADDVTFTTSFSIWEWTSVAFDTSRSPAWTYSNDEIIIDVAGNYRIELAAKVTTVDASRVLVVVELDTGGGYNIEPGGTIFIATNGSAGTGYSDFTKTLAKDDKLRVRVRRLSGTPPSSTNGANGPVWRITKVG
jgi:hypothetical protein